MEENVKKILFEELPKTHYGKALDIYLQEELTKLNDVSTMQSWDDTLGRKKAVEIVKKILRFLNIEKEEGKRTDYR